MPIPGNRPGTKIISLTGDLGSGKSTVAGALEKLWGVSRYSTGNAQREIAAQRGMTTLELNQLAEKDPSIDQQIDSAFRNLAQSPDDLIVDSRLAWHFLHQSFKIKLTVCPRIAAQRIYSDKTRRSEKVDTPEQILESILARKASEVERFKKTYGIHLEDDANYDLIVDTSTVPASEVVALIDRLSPRFFSGEHTERHWIPPKALYPSARARITEGGLEMPPDEFDKAPVLVVDHQRLYLIVDGHTRTSKALMSHVPFIPARALRMDEPVPGTTLTGAEFYRAKLNSSILDEWEDIHEFHYPIRPDPSEL